MLLYLDWTIARNVRTSEGENDVGAPNGEARASTTLADDYRVAVRLIGKDMVEY